MQTDFISAYVSIWGPGFHPLNILGPNPGRRAPPVGWKLKITILSRQGLLSYLILEWAVVVLLSSWRLWGLVCEGVWLEFKPRAWLQRTPFLLARNCLLIVFRVSLCSLFASLTSLPAGLLTISPITLKPWNCPWIETIRFGVEFPFPLAVISRMLSLSHPLFLYHLPLLITRFPHKMMLAPESLCLWKVLDWYHPTS